MVHGVFEERIGCLKGADMQEVELKPCPFCGGKAVIHVNDGVKVIKTIIKMYKDFKPRKFFWCIGFIIILLGIIIGAPVIMEFIKYRYIYKIPSAILATGLEILAIIILQCGVILDTIVKQHREDYEINLINYETKEKNNKN